MVWHLRDVLSATHFGGLLRWGTIFLANHVAARVVVNSRATGEAFVAHGGNRELLYVVHNGIDGAPFAALRDAECAALRQELGLGGCVAVGLFGRIAHWKGQHVLLEALKSLPDVKAIIVGDALFGEQAYQQQLLQLADVPALRGRVRFMSYRSDIPALMRAVDIVVHTSVEPEPFGRVIVEGMLAQRPVIATAAGGVMEILEDGVDGILVPPNDARRLAQAIAALARDPAWARELAVAGCRKAQEQFSVERMCLGIRDAIRGTVAVTH